MRAAGVQAVSPAQRGRSGATRLDGGEPRARCGSDEDYQPSVLPTDSAEDPETPAPEYELGDDDPLKVEIVLNSAQAVVLEGMDT